MPWEKGSQQLGVQCGQRDGQRWLESGNGIFSSKYTEKEENSQ